MNIWTSGLEILIKNVYTPDKCSGVNLSNSRIKASATVEAAIVMPLFIYAVTAVLYMLQIVMIKQDMNVAMYNTVRTMAKYSYVYDKLTDADKDVSAVTAYGTLLSELGIDYAKKHYIVGGNAGIVLLGTEVVGDGEINVKVTYSVKNPFDIFSIGVVTITQTYSSQGWLGDEGVSESLKNSSEEKTVFITLYGDVYHTNVECAYINLSVTAIPAGDLATVRNLSGGRFYGCELCMEDDSPSAVGTVFVTHYGDRYHKTEECSGIKRTVIKVPFSKAKERSLCKKCMTY